MGLSPPDQIPGPAIPFGSNTRTLLSFRNKIPGWGYPFRLNTRTGIPPSDEIPGRCYLLETKYQNGVTPFRSNTRKLLSFRGKIPGWDDPPSELIAGRGYPHSDQIPGLCCPLGTKYQDEVTPFRSNTRTVLSFMNKRAERKERKERKETKERKERKGRNERKERKERKDRLVGYPFIETPCFT